ncbi:MAG: cell envelope integrity protein TolA [Pseudomonadota bacterium]
MRETRADTAEAIVLALLLHAVPVLLLLLASLWRAPDGGTAGEPVVADVVDLNALSASTRAALRRAPERPQPPEPAPPEPEPPPEESLPEPLEETPPEQQLQPQEQLPDPDTVDQQEVVPDAAAELAQREQEARRRQGQVDLTDERRRQEQAEQRQTEMQRQREQQLADLRRQRADEQRKIDLAEERLRQLADSRARQASAAAANPPPGNRGANDNAALAEAYRQALMQAIRSNWTQPDNVSPTQVCKIVIRQIPGGTVVDAQVDPSCPYDEAGKRSVEAAVLKAQPLPHRGFEAVFNRTLILNFRAEDR